MYDGGGSSELFSVQQLILFEMGEGSDLRTNLLKETGDDAILISGKYKDKRILFRSNGTKAAAQSKRVFIHLIGLIEEVLDKESDAILVE